MSSITVPATLAEPFVLALSVQGFSGGIEGLSPTVAIRDARTTNEYLDFADLVFKTAGWSTQFAPLAEVGNGRYVRQVDGDPAGDDPYLWTLDARQPPLVPAYFIAEFDVPNLNGEDDLIVLSANLPGEEFDRDLDETGSDSLGWQEVQTNRAGREIRRFNLYDHDGNRVTGAPENFNGVVRRRELV